MAIPNTVPITGPVAPTATGDTYPSHTEEYGRGGYRSVADNTERDAIPAARRKEGMLVYVTSTTTAYRLDADLVTWTVADGNIDPADVMLKSVYDTTDSGVVDDSERLDNQLPSYYLDRTNHTGTQAQATVTNLTSDLAAKIPLTQKGAANGVAPLNASTKIDNSYLDFPVPLNYAGVWNATTNTPALADGVGSASDAYITSVAGTQDLGSGNITFAVGDIVVYDGSVWQKVPTAGVGVSQVTTALGIQTGAVVIDDTTYIDPSTDRNYVTDDEDDALANANNPNAANPFATIADVVASSVTYALTPDEFANGHTIGDNTTRTLTSLGYTNVTAAAAWPLVAANAAWVGAIDVVNMTIDWISIQEALLTIETGQRTFFFSPNGTRRYRVNHTIKLPRINGTGSGTPININFGGAKIFNVSGNDLIVLDRFPPDQTTADNSWAGYPLHLSDVIVVGNGTNTNVNNIGVRVGANIKGSYIRVFPDSCAVNMALYFNLMVRIQDCQFTGCGLYNLVCSDASASSNTLGDYPNTTALGYSWTGATNSNSQCNIVIYDNVRFQPGGAATKRAGLYIKGGYGHSVRDCNLENCGVTIDSCIHYEGSGDPTQNPLIVDTFSGEITNCDVQRAIIRIRHDKGLFVLNAINFYVAGTPNGLTAYIECDNRSGSSELPSVRFTNTVNTYNAPLRSIVTAPNATNGAGRQFQWTIDNVGLINSKNVFDPVNWVSSGAPVWNGVTPNSVIPEKFKMRYKARFISINDYIVSGTTQEFPDIHDFPRVSAGYDNSSPVGVITPTQIGQTFIKTTAPQAAYISTGLTSSDWVQIS